MVHGGSVRQHQDSLVTPSVAGGMSQLGFPLGRARRNQRQSNGKIAVPVLPALTSQLRSGANPLVRESRPPYNPLARESRPH